MDKSVANNCSDVFTVFAAEDPIPYEMANRSARSRKDGVARGSPSPPTYRHILLKPYQD
jgi:hypothetical protein